MSSFAKTRLTVGRTWRGLTMRELANAIGTVPQSVTFWEDHASDRTPTPEVLQKLSFALKFPVSFFTGSELDLVGAEEVSFRARRSLKATTRDRALARGTFANEVLFADMLTRFKMPEVNVPDYSAEEPATAAKLLRDHWRLGTGPIHNMVHLLEKMGVAVFWMQESAPNIDAFSLLRNKRPYVMMNSNNPKGDRSRFSLAHELGHLVLHREETLTDTKEFIMIDSAAMERQADSFASAFLMPEEQFPHESPRLPNFDAYLKLKPRWGVSIQAMIRRGKDLSLFSEWHYEQAMKWIGARGWRINEPLTPPCERSILHQLVFDRLALKNITPRDFADLHNIVFSDLTELMPAASQIQPRANVNLTVERRGVTLTLTKS